MDPAQLVCFLGHISGQFRLWAQSVQNSAGVLNQPCQREQVVFCQCAHHPPFKFCGKTVECGKRKQEGRLLSCDSDWAIYYARRFLADQKVNRKFSLGISMENFPLTLGKGLHFTFTLAHLGYQKGEREKTKPGGEGQRFNICKCFYVS